MAQKRIKVKPGKTQSKIGFVVGVIFVFLGCVMVIPTFGAFGLLWTAIAGIIAFSHFKNGFSEDGVATHEIIIEDGDNVKELLDDGEDIEAKLIKLGAF